MKQRWFSFYFFAVVFLGILFPPFSMAQQNYFSMGGGWVAGGEPEERTDTFGGVQSVTYDGGVGWGAFAAYGFDWERVRAEVETTFRRHKLDATVIGSAGAEKASIDTGVTSIMVNVLYDLHLLDRFEFSLGGGVGGSFYAIDDFHTENYSVDYIPGWEVTYQVVAELSFLLNDRFTIGLRYHYLDVFDTGNENASDASDIFALLRYNF